MIAAVAMGVGARAACAVVVYPTGNPASDASAVQTAVNSGGTVLLKATNTSGIRTPFDFGATNQSLTTLSVVDNHIWNEATQTWEVPEQ